MQYKLASNAEVAHDVELLDLLISLPKCWE